MKTDHKETSKLIKKTFPDKQTEEKFTLRHKEHIINLVSTCIHFAQENEFTMTKLKQIMLANLFLGAALQNDEMSRKEKQ